MASAIILPSGAIIAAPIPDGTPRPIYTRQNVFSIPFQIDATTGANDQETTVQLYVSADRGATWGRYAEIERQQGRFTFRAQRDGEYWFSVRLSDSRAAAAISVVEPELVVVVDTIAPKLELTAARGRAGEIIARWKIIEPSLDPTSLQVDYRWTEASGPWQPLAVEPIDTAASGPAYPGRAIWWDQAGSGKIGVRVQARDLAGNPAAIEAAVQPGSQPASDIASADGASERVRYAEELSERSGATSKQWLPDHVAAVPLSHSQNPLLRGPAPPQLSEQFPGRTEPRDESPAAATPRNESGSASGGTPQIESDRHQGSPSPPHKGFDPFSDETFGPRSSQMHRPTQISPSNPPIANRFKPTGPEGSILSTHDLPPGERLRMINSKQFAIEYSLALTPSQQAPVVELWGSRDGGGTWSRYATDEDGKSPVPVTVGEEGLYGFRLSSRANVRAQSERPAAGERPEMWIGVDSTPPQARLTGVHEGRGPEAGRLQIAWEASDQRLGYLPVSLYYRLGEGHSWTAITGALPASGSYSWQVPTAIAKQIYVRLEVRDEAGNMQVVDWPQVVTCETAPLPRPAGGITPNPRSSQGARREQTYIR